MCALQRAFSDGPISIALGSYGWARLSALLLVAPAVSVARELLVAFLALFLRTFVASGWWQPAVHLLRVDPVYTGAAIRSLGSAKPLGVAVAGPVGWALHRLLPVVFLAPDRVLGGAFASMVAAPGASILERAVVVFVADVAVLTVGLLLTIAARRRAWLLVAGLLVQMEVVIGHLLSLHVGAHDLEVSGVPFALALIIPSSGWWITEQLARLPDVFQEVLVGSGLVLLAYIVAFGASLMARRTWRIRGWRARPLRVYAIGLLVAAATISSPFGALTRGASNWLLADPPNSPAVVFASGDASLENPALMQPHAVRLAQDGSGNWRYLVDGSPEVIRGVGYNPQYASLPPTERARLYQRDFSEIRAIGANTIEGWFQEQFDEVTLDYAARNGLGVFVPFELNQDWNYADPAVQADILQRVSDWVTRYRNSPALRMWAPGNENMHRILYRNWVSQLDDSVARARAQAFAAFLPRLVDRIHELDPDHPVLYRDAEDVYMPWLQQGFAQSPNQAPRPWLVYGANVYSQPRLDEIIAGWPTQWFGGPLIISEFAPTGSGPQDRALGYAGDWQHIRAHPEIVLGGLAYAWGTNGPEDLDRVFGLVDADGNPNDAALTGLASVYRRDAALAEAPSATGASVMLGNG